MESVKTFFLENWKAKLLSLLIGLGIWLMIKSHLDRSVKVFPVPGTEGPLIIRDSSPVPDLEDRPLGRLVTPPVPGGE